MDQTKKKDRQEGYSYKNKILSKKYQKQEERGEKEINDKERQICKDKGKEIQSTNGTISLY